MKGLRPNTLLQRMEFFLLFLVHLGCAGMIGWAIFQSQSFPQLRVLLGGCSIAVGISMARQAWLRMIYLKPEVIKTDWNLTPGRWDFFSLALRRGRGEIWVLCAGVGIALYGILELI